MDYLEAIEPVTVLKTKSAELIRKVKKTGQPVIITQNGKATAVLQDIEDFQRQKKALLLLRFLAKGDQQLREGKAISHAKASKHFDEKLKELNGD
jgi:prevent-host-death family protein